MRLLILILFVVSLNLPAQDRDSVLAVIEKVNSVKKAISAEQASWREEKKSLELELQLIKDALKSGKISDSEISDRLNSLKIRKDAVLKKAEAIRSKLKNQNFQLNTAAASFLKLVDMVPAPLSQHIQKETADLKNSLDSQDGLFKLNSINALIQGMLTLQKNTHRVRQIISVDGKDIEVEALYLGTACGYYLSLKQNIAGRLLLKEGKWITESRLEIFDSLKTAFEQMDRKGHPQLIQLPAGGAK